jgi:nitrite reductase/ring-hydroxylating ferredoxin subunit/thioredoxin reductase
MKKSFFGFHRFARSSGPGLLQRVVRVDNKTSKLIKLAMLGLLSSCEGMRQLLLEDKSMANDREDPVQSFQSLFMNSYEISLPVTEKGSPAKVSVTLKETGQPFNFLLVQTPDRHIYAVGATCPYDGVTDLSKGLVVRNKLICPEHGCEFEVKSGLVEYPPAMDSLPIFPVTYLPGVNPEDFKISVQIPNYPPKKVIPFSVGKVPQDFRKVAIIGSGAAGMGAAETLRKMIYAGEIIIFTSEDVAPVQRHNLTRFTRIAGNEELLFIRNRDFWKSRSVDLMLNKTVKKLELADDYGYLQLEEGPKYYFDGVIVATGTNATSKYESDLYAKNFILLNTINDFKKAERLLPFSRKVAINNITFESLQLASTLKHDYPELDIHLFNQGKSNMVEQELGKEVYRTLVDNFRKSGIKFHTHHPFQRFVMNKGQDKLKQVVYGDENVAIKAFSPDMVYHFANRPYPNTGIIDSSKYSDEMGKNDFGQIEVNEQQRSQLRYAFAAGSCSSTVDAANKFNIVRPSFADSYFQGEIAAYNILGLRMPNYRTTHNYFNYLGKTFHMVGAKLHYDEIITHGDKDSMNFISYYTLSGMVISAFGSPEHAREVLMIREALNNGYVLNADNLKENPASFYDKLYDSLTNLNTPACRREIIFDKRNNVVISDVIWKEREDKEDLYAQNFENYKQMSLND